MTQHNPKNQSMPPCRSWNGKPPDFTQCLADLADSHPEALGLVFSGIKGSAKIFDRNDAVSAQFNQSSIHWKCHLSSPLGKAAFSFSKGSGIDKEVPSVMELLECVLSDAKSAQEHDDFESLISEGFLDMEDPSCTQKARVLYRSLQKVNAQCQRLSGPFWGAQSSKEVLVQAKALCAEHPELANPSQGRPWGLLELSVACGDLSLFSILCTGSDPGLMKRAASCADIADAFGHMELVDCAKALAEREILRIQCTSARANGPKTRL